LVQIEASGAQKLSINRFNIEEIANYLESIEAHFNVSLILVGQPLQYFENEALSHSIRCHLAQFTGDRTFIVVDGWDVCEQFL
jgi:hypothetical protein